MSSPTSTTMPFLTPAGWPDSCPSSVILVSPPSPDGSSGSRHREAHAAPMVRRVRGACEARVRSHDGRLVRARELRRCRSGRQSRDQAKPRLSNHGRALTSGLVQVPESPARTGVHPASLLPHRSRPSRGLCARSNGLPPDPGDRPRRHGRCACGNSAPRARTSALLGDREAATLDRWRSVSTRCTRSRPPSPKWRTGNRPRRGFRARLPRAHARPVLPRTCACAWLPAASVCTRASLFGHDVEKAAPDQIDLGPGRVRRKHGRGLAPLPTGTYRGRRSGRRPRVRRQR